MEHYQYDNEIGKRTGDYDHESNVSDDEDQYQEDQDQQDQEDQEQEKNSIDIYMQLHNDFVDNPEKNYNLLLSLMNEIYKISNKKNEKVNQMIDNLRKLNKSKYTNDKKYKYIEQMYEDTLGFNLNTKINFYDMNLIDRSLFFDIQEEIEQDTSFDESEEEKISKFQGKLLSIEETSDSDYFLFHKEKVLENMNNVDKDNLLLMIMKIHNNYDISKKCQEFYDKIYEFISDVKNNKFIEKMEFKNVFSNQQIVEKFYEYLGTGPFKKFSLEEKNTLEEITDLFKKLIKVGKFAYFTVQGRKEVYLIRKYSDDEIINHIMIGDEDSYFSKYLPKDRIPFNFLTSEANILTTNHEGLGISTISTENLSESQIMLNDFNEQTLGKKVSDTILNELIETHQIQEDLNIFKLRKVKEKEIIGKVETDTISVLLDYFNDLKQKDKSSYLKLYKSIFNELVSLSKNDKSKVIRNQAELILTEFMIKNDDYIDSLFNSSIRYNKYYNTEFTAPAPKADKIKKTHRKCRKGDIIFIEEDLFKIVKHIVLSDEDDEGNITCANFTNYKVNQYLKFAKGDIDSETKTVNTYTTNIIFSNQYQEEFRKRTIDLNSNFKPFNAKRIVPFMLEIRSKSDIEDDIVEAYELDSSGQTLKKEVSLKSKVRKDRFEYSWVYVDEDDITNASNAEFSDFFEGCINTPMNYYFRLSNELKSAFQFYYYLRSESCLENNNFLRVSLNNDLTENKLVTLNDMSKIKLTVKESFEYDVDHKMFLSRDTPCNLSYKIGDESNNWIFSDFKKIKLQKDEKPMLYPVFKSYYDTDRINSGPTFKIISEDEFNSYENKSLANVMKVVIKDINQTVYIKYVDDNPLFRGWPLKGIIYQEFSDYLNNLIDHKINILKSKYLRLSIESFNKLVNEIDIISKYLESIDKLDSHEELIIESYKNLNELFNKNKVKIEEDKKNKAIENLRLRSTKNLIEAINDYCFLTDINVEENIISDLALEYEEYCYTISKMNKNNEDLGRLTFNIKEYSKKVDSIIILINKLPPNLFELRLKLLLLSNSVFSDYAHKIYLKVKELREKGKLFTFEFYFPVLDNLSNKNEILNSLNETHQDKNQIIYLLSSMNISLNPFERIKLIEEIQLYVDYKILLTRLRYENYKPTLFEKIPDTVTLIRTKSNNILSNFIFENTRNIFNYKRISVYNTLLKAFNKFGIINKMNDDQNELAEQVINIENKIYLVSNDFKQYLSLINYISKNLSTDILMNIDINFINFIFELMTKLKIKNTYLEEYTKFEYSKKSNEEIMKECSEKYLLLWYNVDDIDISKEDYDKMMLLKTLKMKNLEKNIEDLKNLMDRDSSQLDNLFKQLIDMKIDNDDFTRQKELFFYKKEVKEYNLQKIPLKFLLSPLGISVTIDLINGFVVTFGKNSGEYFFLDSDVKKVFLLLFFYNVIYNKGNQTFNKETFNKLYNAAVKNRYLNIRRTDYLFENKKDKKDKDKKDKEKDFVKIMYEEFVNNYLMKFNFFKESSFDEEDILKVIPNINNIIHKKAISLLYGKKILKSLIEMPIPFTFIDNKPVYHFSQKDLIYDNLEYISPWLTTQIGRVKESDLPFIIDTEDFSIYKETNQEESTRVNQGYLLGRMSKEYIELEFLQNDKIKSYSFKVAVDPLDKNIQVVDLIESYNVNKLNFQYLIDKSKQGSERLLELENQNNIYLTGEGTIGSIISSDNKMLNIIPIKTKSDTKNVWDYEPEFSPELNTKWNAKVYKYKTELRQYLKTYGIDSKVYVFMMEKYTAILELMRFKLANKSLNEVVPVYKDFLSYDKLRYIESVVGKDKLKTLSESDIEMYLNLKNEVKKVQMINKDSEGTDPLVYLEIQRNNVIGFYSRGFINFTDGALKLLSMIKNSNERDIYKYFPEYYRMDLFNNANVIEIKNARTSKTVRENVDFSYLYKTSVIDKIDLFLNISRNVQLYYPNEDTEVNISLSLYDYIKLISSNEQNNQIPINKKFKYFITEKDILSYIGDTYLQFEIYPGTNKQIVGVDINSSKNIVERKARRLVSFMNINVDQESLNYKYDLLTIPLGYSEKINQERKKLTYNDVYEYIVNGGGNVIPNMYDEVVYDSFDQENKNKFIQVIRNDIYEPVFAKNEYMLTIYNRKIQEVFKKIESKVKKLKVDDEDLLKKTNQIIKEECERINKKVNPNIYEPYISDKFISDIYFRPDLSPFNNTFVYVSKDRKTNYNIDDGETQITIFQNKINLVSKVLGISKEIINEYINIVDTRVDITVESDFSKIGPTKKDSSVFDEIFRQKYNIKGKRPLTFDQRKMFIKEFNEWKKQ